MRLHVSLPTLGKVSINFYGLASSIIDLYDRMGEFDRQKQIRHLGLISTVFEGASHSRYEYVMLQCCISELLDNIYKGSSTAAQGSISVGGQSHHGNGLLKSWFLLSNFGHTKNTIGDEKSLLLFCLRRPGFKSCLLSSIRDQLLRAWADQAILEFRYSDFHHVLSIRRVYKSLPRQLEKQDTIATIYKLLLINEDDLDIQINKQKLNSLRRLYDTIRALAIVTLDGHYSHSPASVDLMSVIMSLESLEHTYSGKQVFDSLRNILSTLNDDIYLDQTVLARQRQYEVDSLNILRDIPKNSSCYETAITKAFEHGIAPVTTLKHTPFARLVITESMQPGTQFYDEIRNIQTVRRGCKGVEASLDYNTLTKTRFADFFIDSDVFTRNDLPRFVFNISSMIEDQITHIFANKENSVLELLGELRDNAINVGVDAALMDEALERTDNTISLHAWEAFKNDVLPAFKNLLWSILTFFINNKYHIDIDSTNTKYDIFGMKFPHGDFGLLTDNIESAISIEKDTKHRVHELRQLHRSAKRPFDGYVFVCLAPITVYDPSKPPQQRLVTDIDSAVVKVNKNKIYVELNEAKNMRRNIEGTAKKELREKVVPVLNANASGHRISSVKGYGAKLTIKCGN